MRWILALLFLVSMNAQANTQAETVETQQEVQVEGKTEEKHESKSESVSAVVDQKDNKLTASSGDEKGAKAEDKENSDKDVAAATAQNSDKLKSDNRVESEIPLNLENNKKASAEEGGFFKMILSLSILGVVGTGAFIFLKKYSVPKDRKHQTQIKVLQQHFLGPKKSLAIVRVAGESILIGITDQNISMIKSLSLLDEEVPEDSPASFNKVLNGDLDRKKVSFAMDSNSEAQALTEFELDPNENADQMSFSQSAQDEAQKDTKGEFAMGGLRDVVSKKLRSMRAIQ